MKLKKYKDFYHEGYYDDKKLRQHVWIYEDNLYRFLKFYKDNNFDGELLYYIKIK